MEIFYNCKKITTPSEMNSYSILHITLMTSYFQTIIACIQTTTGPIIGTINIYDNKIIDVYLGIPYATPPIGALRFRKPIPVQPWTIPFLAYYYPPACVQYYPYEYPWVDSMVGQSEDCLYLNIWIPRSTDEKSLKAAMVWVHGTGFYSGSNKNKLYDGRVLAAKGDVIVITVNYRLGIFGFLSTPSKDAPGNMGVHDILEALKWIKNNIRIFGGDASRITVFGASSGAVIAGVLCVSPLAKGLFQRVILESGAPTTLTSDRSYRQNLDLAGRVADAVGCASSNNSVSENPSRVVQCLKSRDANQLAFITHYMSDSAVDTFKFIYGDELLPNNTRLTVRDLQLHKVDVLIGSVQDEGSYYLPLTFPNIFGPFGENNLSINKTFGEEFIRELLSDFSSMTKAVIQKYLGGLEEDDYTRIRNQVYNFCGDFFIFCPTLFFAESYARKGTAVYYYYFNHRSSVTPWAKWMGVTHYSEVSFMFGHVLEVKKVYSEEEESLSIEIIKMWTNFAKFGKPSSEWPMFLREKQYVLTFSLPEDKESSLPTHFENCNFFRPIFGFS